MPSGRPMASWSRDRFKTSHITCPDCAPSAIRTPISDVRWVTEYAVTAYRPTADKINAIAAKIANIEPNTRNVQRCNASSSFIV